MLAKVQDGIYDFRRSTVSRRMEGREGYHNVIAIDDESFSAAQALAGNSNEEGRALKLSTDARGNPILLAEDGRVVTMIEGGSRNRLSIVGRAETLEAYSASDMAAGVSALTQGESIGSVTVHLRDALNLGTDHQPGALERQLRDKLAELHQQGRSAERETFESLTLDYASKVRDLQAKFEVFRAAMDQVYAANPQLTSDDTANTLAA